ncbi:hypothetical protein MWN52_15170 [Pseudoxanthomonas winnipegensis]|uniref:hypothetical protein n=1 Tax=Pseudoxanthomonas winnipegensis TaxID=2480810 RepID=UPI0025760299|nr:hypothetical protein [Pseudoxanthomonas winnipegensis]WJI14951.1 hypothetical protein MWN52_15170 [Pseudoxanthomonas winnipegensis]
MNLPNGQPLLLQMAPSWSYQRQLVEIAERTAAQLIELHRCPTPERCDIMAAALEGTKLHVLQLRTALVQEGTGNGA